MFANLKKYIAKKIILKEIEKQTSIHSYGFCPLSSVKTVLLLAESDEDEKNQELHAFKEQLKAEGKKVIVWAFANKKEILSPIFPEFRLFSLSDLSWFGLPKCELVDQFEAIETDLVISLDMNDSLVLDFLLAKSKAKMKVSKEKGMKQIANFMLSIGKDDNRKYFFEQVLFYLNSIQTKN
ncbi:MAG: hypothetical protein IIW13_01595 [Paludibacteraceae bacterium]|nr:hypothetical protein [Paludibacteraceae bacterium]